MTRILNRFPNNEKARLLSYTRISLTCEINHCGLSLLLLQGLTSKLHQPWLVRSAVLTKINDLGLLLFFEQAIVKLNSVIEILELRLVLCYNLNDTRSYFSFTRLFAKIEIYPTIRQLCPCDCHILAV